MEPTLSQALHLLNGDTVNSKIRQGGLIAKLQAGKKTPEERITELYIRCFSRQPNPEETATLAGALKQNKAPEPQASKTWFWGSVAQ